MNIINDNDKSLALRILDRLTDDSNVKGLEADQKISFNASFGNQNVVMTALKILHKLSSDNVPEISRHKIIALNEHLSSGNFEIHAKKRLGCEIQESEIKDFQIRLPQTNFDKMIETITKIPRAIISILVDLILLPFAGILLLVAACQSNQEFDTKEVKTDRPHIILLHGSGFNKIEFCLAKLFLQKESYGSVSDLNFDGLVSNDPIKGIKDYAGILQKEILRIKNETNQTNFILIGHSMGGMIGGFHAENFAALDGVTIQDVVSIATPWQGAPILEYLSDKPKRYEDMSVVSNFRTDLVDKALASERANKRRYYSVGSTTDPMVPAPHSNLTEDPRRQLEISYLGHYGLIVSPRVWMWVRSHLDNIYQEFAERTRPVLSVRGDGQAQGETKFLSASGLSFNSTTSG